MHKITVGWMYPNLLNLHGERGSVQALVEIGKQLDVEVEIIRIEDFDDSVPYDTLDLLVFLPGETTVLEHLIPALNTDDFKQYFEQGGYALAIGTSGLMFGESITREDGTVLNGLGYLEMTAIERRYVWGDDLHIKLLDSDMELIGSQIQMADVDCKSPLADTIYGMGNNNTGTEGGRWNNLIYTNCLGPLFVKNPWFGEYLLKGILQARGITIEKTGNYPIATASFQSTLDFIASKPKK